MESEEIMKNGEAVQRTGCKYLAMYEHLVSPPFYLEQLAQKMPPEVHGL